VPPLEEDQGTCPGFRSPGDKRVLDGRPFAGCHDARTPGRFTCGEVREDCAATGLERTEYGTLIEVSHRLG
jgi:hypothetical protein